MNARTIGGWIGASAVLSGLMWVLSGCSKSSDDVEPPNPDWILRSHVVFLAADGKTPRSLPKQPMRLWVPYVVGDIYGSPNAGEMMPVELQPDMSFTLNLNLKHLRLAKVLEATRFSQKWMEIEPKEARVARVLPFVVQKDGIQPLGIAEWLDTTSGDKLMLVYVDRPARIRGDIVYEGRSLTFAIDAKEAGFLWVRQPAQSGTYEPVPRPANLVLAVFPGE
ncbi:MAG: hypothetical protein H7Y89_10110 [Steroidobacteraceae bacterium]|nr:hypothetical protein [Steroidobacteraceae bacterium]